MQTGAFFVLFGSVNVLLGWLRQPMTCEAGKEGARQSQVNMEHLINGTCAAK